MASSDRDLSMYECRSCGEYRLAATPPTCCEQPMGELEDPVPIEQPDEERLMRTVFGISGTELEVCRHLMSQSEVRIEELAEAVDRDRTVVTRHLNDLVELGIVEKHSRVLPDGGRVNVYSHRSVEVVRRQFKLGLYTWLVEAVDVIDDISEEKIERMVRQEDAESSPEQVIVDRDESA